MTSRRAARWRACPEGLCGGGGWTVSFQRYLVGEALIDKAPPSLGVLPLGRSGDVFLLPLYDTEAVWIGLSAQASATGPLRVSADMGEGSHVLHASPGGLGVEIIPGAPTRGGGMRALSRANGLTALRFEAGGGAAQVQAVSPTVFAEQTGLATPEPAKVEAAFGGHLLP